MGKMQRAKGARGQSEFSRMLSDRDWSVDPITAGVKREDMIATDPQGKVYSVEVKNCKTISHEHKKQAMEQATSRKLPWMLAAKIFGSSSWLVWRQDAAPTVWHKRT